MSLREPTLTDSRHCSIFVRPRSPSECARWRSKRKHWRDTGQKEGRKFLGKHMIPVILGPKQRTTSSIIIIWRGAA